MHSQAKTHLPGPIFFLVFSLCTIGNGASEFMFLSGTRAMCFDSLYGECAAEYITL